MNSPLVSILIPVYNRESLIGETIKSALNQTITDIEIIIVDNASTDRTWEVCKSFAEKDSRIRIFRNETNVGPVPNWKRCVDEARGKYAKILWSDDLIHPSFLEKTISFFDDKIDVGFVYSGTEIFNNNKEIIHKFYFIGESGYYKTSNYLNSMLFEDQYPYIGGNYPVSPGCAIFRLKDLKQSLVIDIPNEIGSDFSQHAIGNDLLIFLVIANRYKYFGFINESLSYFRLHEDSITISTNKQKIFLMYNLARLYFAKTYLLDSQIKNQFFTSFTNKIIAHRNDLKNYFNQREFISLLNIKPSPIKVSAIVSVYKAEQFIKNCLEDLVSQTLYKKGFVEIIIIDSASPENEQVIIREFQNNYPNIIYLRTYERETLYTAWNRAIHLAQGVYITNANADDAHRPDAFEIMSNYLDNYTDVALVYADQLITQNPNDKWEITNSKVRWNWSEFTYSELEQYCFIGPQPMWRKALHDKYGFFRSDFSSAGDYEFWLRIGKTENLVHLKDILGVYYENPQSLSLSSQAAEQEPLKIWKEYNISRRPLQKTPLLKKTILKEELNFLPYRKLKDTHVLLYSDDPEIYGAAQYNHALLKGLAKTNQYQLICAQSKASHHLIIEREQLGVQHTWISYDTSGQGFGRTLTDTQDAESVFDQTNPDLIIFSDCCPISNLAAKQVAMQKGIPFIVVVHNASPYLAERFAQYLPLLEQTYQLSKAVISVSQANINLLQQYFRLPSNKSKVIYNGRPEEFFSLLNQTNREKIRKELNIPANAVVCFTAARLDSGKGYQYQLEAVKQLKQLAIWDNLYFVWAGTGQLETSLKETIAKLKVENQVKLLGKRSDVANLLDASDLFVLPSDFESFGFAIVEAMAKCVPVIATNVGGIPEVLGETGKLLSNPLVDSDTCIKEVVETIRLWATDSTLRQTIGNACKQRAETFFTEETMLDQTIDLLNNVLTNKLPILESKKEMVDPRQNIVQQWLEISEENLESAFSGELGNKHRELLALEIRQQLCSDEEKQFISELNQYIAKGWKQDKIAQYFLAASLYCYPHQLSRKWFENAEVPEFLVDYFVNFMFEKPDFFKELDESDQYCYYMKDWIDFIHVCITTETDSPIWQQMAWIFTQRANFIPLYFNSENLKEIYVKRAEIMEIALKQRGFQIDFNFPKRDQNRKKIRVGFLSNHFTPLTETFSTLPAFEYLDRGFEVVLYANIVSGHSLEKYCESRVDRLVCLPEDLNAKVQTIRQDDLDFLFICTNTTAVTNQITILALHKLARVQIATFNSPVTTGMKNIDYYLTGKLTEFENSEHYSENLLFLNGQGYCFNYGDFDPKPTQTFTRQLFDLKEEQTIFISAANFYKLTPELKETWVKVIAQVPNSILILMPFGQSWSNQYPKEALVKSLHLLFEKYTISIDRLKLFDPLPNRIEVREALKIADVYLDSYPYSGTTSLIEPLEIGLPSVVRKGNTLRNRMGAAMLQSIHLSDLVVENEESYINLAVKLGTDEKLRSQYREQILEKMANNPPFLDSRSYSTQIGDVLKQLFEKHL